MSLVAMKYLYDLELIDDQGREDAVAKHTMLAICWSYVDGCEQVTVAYETLRRRVHFSPSAIRAALARLSDEQQGYGLLQIRSRTRGPQAEVVFALNLEKLRELYGAEQLELRMTSLRAVTEETPSGGETLSGETPPGGETQQNNATRWRNSEKDTPPGGETPAEIRHLVAKPGLHEGSHISVSNSLCHSLSRTPLSPPVERERLSGFAVFAPAVVCVGGGAAGYQKSDCTSRTHGGRCGQRRTDGTLAGSEAGGSRQPRHRRHARS